MRHAAALLALLAPLALIAFQAPTGGDIRLIIKGDDMGAAHGINTASIDAYKRGVLTTTNVIVPSPWFKEAARLINENPGLDVGVHLAITSEWDNIKWRPLTAAPSIVDPDGFFFSIVASRPGFPPRISVREAPWKLDEIERELRAQIVMAQRHMPQVSYTWNHMGFTSLAPEVDALVLRLSKEYGLVVPTKLGMNMVGRVWEPNDSGGVKADKMAAKFETLTPGLWMFIDHAATMDAEMLAIGHHGADFVAAERTANHDAWISPKVREVITRRGIKLTNYREVAKSLH